MCECVCLGTFSLPRPSSPISPKTTLAVTSAWVIPFSISLYLGSFRGSSEPCSVRSFWPPPYKRDGLHRVASEASGYATVYLLPSSSGHSRTRKTSFFLVGPKASVKNTSRSSRTLASPFGFPSEPCLSAWVVRVRNKAQSVGSA